MTSDRFDSLIFRVNLAVMFRGHVRAASQTFRNRQRAYRADDYRHIGRILPDPSRSRTQNGGFAGDPRAAARDELAIHFEAATLVGNAKLNSISDQTKSTTNGQHDPEQVTPPARSDQQCAESSG